MKRRKSSFYPVGSLDGKNNYKPFFRIEEDGSIIERVFLNIPDSSEREYIICLHYLRFIRQHFHDENIGIKILDRDSPWDFILELSTGNMLNVEITSIADMQKHFIINKNEERYSQWASKEKIPLHELEKLNRLFPNDKITSIIEESKCSENNLIQNPFYNSGKSIFLSTMPNETINLSTLIKEVISKKASKKHLNKDRTVIIIDNRTSLFEVSDYMIASEEVSSYCESLPFPEIWFYTGYCSDSDGNNAEYSFAPLKVTKQQEIKLLEMSNSSKIDKNGTLVC